MVATNESKSRASSANEAGKSSLLQTLHEAAAFLHKSAWSEVQVFRSFEERLEQTGLQGSILLYSHDGKQLETHAITLLAGARKNHQVPFLEFSTSEIDIFNHVLEADKSRYLADTSELAMEIFRDVDQNLFPHVTEAFSKQAAIFSPIHIEGWVQGILGIYSKDLTPEDIPAVEAFADHFSIALENARRFASLVEMEDRYHLTGSTGKSRGADINERDTAERKRAEAALRESERKFRSIVEQSTDGIVLVDENGTIIEWNKGQEQITGLARAEVLGRSIWNVQFNIAPEDKHNAELFNMIRSETIEYLHTGQAPWVNQLREHDIIDAHGERRTIQVINFPIRTEKGFMAGSVLRDVSEHKKMETSLRRKAEEMAALHTVSLNITAAQELPDLLQIIIEQAVQLLDGSGGLLNLCDPERQEIRLAVSYQSKSKEVGSVLKYGEGAAGMIAVTGEPLLISDYRNWPKRVDFLEEDPPYRAVIGAPMMWQGQVTGVVIIFHKDERRSFTPTDLEILTLFANQAAIAIENARLLEAERAARERAETLREVAHAVSSSLEFDQVLQLILQQLKRVLTFDATSVFLFSEQDKPALVTGIGYLNPDVTGQEASKLLADSPILKAMARDLEPVLIPDVRQHPDWIWITGVEQVRSFLGVPIISRGKMIGALMMDSQQTNFFTEADVHTAQTLAQHIAIAIENARIYETEGRRAAELEAVRQASLSLTASLELHQVLNAILKATLGLLPEAYDSHIFLYNPEDGGRLTFGAALWAEGSQSGPWSEPRPHGLTYTVARQGEPIVVRDMQDHPIFAGAPESWVGAIVGLPLKIGQNVVGVMNIAYRQPRDFLESELHMMRLLGDHAAIAIENARLFEQAATERRHLSLLYDINRELAASLEIDEILSRAISLTCQALDGLVGYAYLYLEEENILSIRAVTGGTEVSLDELNAGPQMRPGVGLTGWVAEQREPVNVPDVTQDSRWLHVPGIDEDARSAICAPVMAGNRLLGVLIVLHSKPGAFSKDHLALMQAICQEVGLALSNASRYQQVQRRLAENTLIQSLTQAFNQRLEIQILLEDVVSQLAGRLGYQQVRIFLVESDVLTLKAYYGPKPPETNYSLDQGIIGRVARTGQVAFTPDVTRDSDYQACIEETISELAVPIFRDKSVVGVINIESDQPDQLSVQDRDLLEVLAGQISVALENAVLYERVLHHAEELENTVAQRTAELAELYKLSQEIGYQLSYEELLRLLLHHLRSAVRSELAVGCLFTNESRLLIIETSRPVSAGVIAQIQANCQETFAKNEQAAPEIEQLQAQTIFKDKFAEQAAPLQKITSIIQAPIFINQKIVGLLLAIDGEKEAFGNEQERLLTTFANQAATAMQRLAAVLTAQQKHLENLVEHVPVGILLFDSELNLLMSNPLGREILSTLNAGNTDTPQIKLGSYSLRDLVAHYDDPIPIEITLDGPPRRVFGAQTRQMGDDKHQWVLTIREITQERENQDRIQSQERLATVGQLAAGIAHDFNNIMAAILVYADLLHQDPNIQAFSREKLTIIQQQVQRAASLIRQILDFSRRSVMEQSSLDLLPFIKELDKMLGRVLPETIRLELIYKPGTYWINADPTRLQQVFMNLAINAKDAMPEGGLLHFELDRFHLAPGVPAPVPDMPAGEWVHITVTDTGVGIPPDVQPHIFDPFFTTKPVGQGTGLGLAQVYGIIKQHDGHIDVKSRLGEGTTFNIYLPALQTDEKIIKPSEPSLRVKGKGETVLVVEDNEATREALQALLEAQNYRVLSASNGMDALKLFEGTPEKIILIVSDVVMPQMGGMALYRTLRERSPGVKMLFITGHPMEVENQTLLEKGTVHWLQKPFSVLEFNHAVRSLLENGNQQR